MDPPAINFGDARQGRHIFRVPLDLLELLCFVFSSNGRERGLSVWGG